MKVGKSSRAKNPSVGIVILNWNSWEDTIECLESLYQITYPNYSIILVDNGSENESIQKIKEYTKGKIKVKSKYLKYNPKNKPIKVLELTNKMAARISNKSDLGKKDKEILKLKSNEKLILIKNDKNYGFAEGTNIGMRFALKIYDFDYLLMLNNDTAVEPDFLTKMVTAGEEHPKAGIIGPRIPYYDHPDRNWFCKGIVNWFSINIAYHDEI